MICIKSIYIALTQDNIPTFKSLFWQSTIEANINEN